jgi:hypothetical protein
MTKLGDPGLTELLQALKMDEKLDIGLSLCYAKLGLSQKPWR